MSYLRTPTNENTFMPGTTNEVGNINWASIPPDSDKKGHRYLTIEAIGDGKISFMVMGKRITKLLTANEKEQIIKGNLSVDEISPKIILPEEQKRHALRSTFAQSQANALTDIVTYLRGQHTNILNERNPIQRLWKIGAELHLIQDSFCPVHTSRNRNSGWCIKHINSYPIEHNVIDSGDSVDIHPNEASKAIQVSRIYLQIIFKVIFGKIKPDPKASEEAEQQFEHFIAAYFRQC